MKERLFFVGSSGVFEHVYNGRFPPSSAAAEGGWVGLAQGKALFAR